jgi:hypothetical protein
MKILRGVVKDLGTRKLRGGVVYSVSVGDKRLTIYDEAEEDFWREDVHNTPYYPTASGLVMWPFPDYCNQVYHLIVLQRNILLWLPHVRKRWQLTVDLLFSRNPSSKLRFLSDDILFYIGDFLYVYSETKVDDICFTSDEMDILNRPILPIIHAQECLKKNH